MNGGFFFERTIVVPIAGATSGVDRGSGRNRRTAGDTEFAGFFLHNRGQLGLGAHCALGLLPLLVTGAELVKAEGTWSEVSALVQTTLVADDFSRVKSRAPPRGRLGGVAIEATATKILCLFRGSIVGVLDMKAIMGLHVRHGHGWHAARRLRTVKGMRRDHHRPRIFDLDVSAVMNILVRREIIFGLYMGMLGMGVGISKGVGTLIVW